MDINQSGSCDRFRSSSLSMAQQLRDLDLSIVTDKKMRRPNIGQRINFYKGHLRPYRSRLSLPLQSHRSSPGNFAALYTLRKP